MALRGTEVAPGRAEDIAVAVAQHIPALGFVVQAVAEQVLHSEGIAARCRAARLGDEGSGEFRIGIIGALHEGLACGVVLHGPGQTERQEIKLDVHAQHGPLGHREGQDDGVVFGIAVSGQFGPHREVVVAQFGGKLGQGHILGLPGGEVAIPGHRQVGRAVEGEVDPGFGHRGGAEILEGHCHLVGGLTSRRGNALNGRNARIHIGHRNRPGTGQQAGPVLEQRIPHPGALSFREGGHARVIAVVHEVLDHGALAFHGVATDGARGGRRVANAVPLGGAVGLRATALREVERVVEPEVVTDFVGEGPAQVEVGHQVELLANPKDLVVDHNAIQYARDGRQVGIAERGGATVELGGDVDVQVIGFGPMTECLDRRIRCLGAQIVGHDAVLREFGQDVGHVDPNNAGGRIALRIPGSQLKGDADVRSPEAAIEVDVQGVDGAVDLGLGEVGAFSHGVSVVEDVHDHRNGVGLAGPEGAYPAFFHGGLEREKAAGKRRIRFHQGGQLAIGRAPTSLAPRSGGGQHGHKGDKGGQTGWVAGHRRWGFLPLTPNSKLGLHLCRDSA